MLSVKKKSQKQEKDIAAKIGGKPVIASGALWGAKGDVRTDSYLIEAKTTDGDYYTLNVDTWEKISREALEDSLRVPLMIIDLKGGEERVVIFDSTDFDINVNYVLAPEKKSIRISSGMVGYDDYGNYTNLVSFKLCGVHTNTLCCMLFSDFNEEFKEVLEWE